MLRRWLKPCPRCRDNHLLEMKGSGLVAVRCVHCGYTLNSDEVRRLLESSVSAPEAMPTAA